jgi:hypothetical protein
MPETHKQWVDRLTREARGRTLQRCQAKKIKFPGEPITLDEMREALVTAHLGQCWTWNFGKRALRYGPSCEKPCVTCQKVIVGTVQVIPLSMFRVRE